MSMDERKEVIKIRLTLTIGLMPAIISTIISGCDSVDGVSGASSANIERITKEELNTLLDDQADVLVVDVRSKNLYSFGHIPGAISMTYPDEIRYRHQELPIDKTLIFY